MIRAVALALVALVAAAHGAALPPKTTQPTPAPRPVGNAGAPLAGYDPNRPAIVTDTPEEEEGAPGEENGVYAPEATPAAAFEAEERDAALVAATFGWGLHATRAHMMAQRRFAGLVSFVERRYPRAFAGSAYARRPGAPATIYLRAGDADVPDKLRRAVAAFSDETGVEVAMATGMRHSARDQDRRLDEIAAHMEATGRAAPDMSVLPGDIIMLSLPASAEFPPTPVPAEAKGGGQFEAGSDSDAARPDAGARDHVDPNAAALLPQGFDARGVIIVFVDGPRARDFHVRGGRKVYSDPDGRGLVGECTAGFSVYRVSDGKNGVATAAHCTGMKHFDAESPEDDFRLYHRREHEGDYGDMEWKSSDHTELPEYWANTRDLRYVTSQTNSFSNNDVHCLYSRRRGARYCDRVYSVNVRQSGANKLIAMDHNSGVAGDSGGPWSNGSEASGIVKGAKVIWFYWRDTFSKVKLLNSALGVKLLKH